MTDHLRSYDVTLVRPRIASCYDNWRKIHVRRIVWEIGSAPIDPVDVDEAMQPEIELFDDLSPGTRAALTVIHERTLAEHRRLVDLLRESGKPMTRKEMSLALGKSHTWMGNNLGQIDEVIHMGNRGNSKIYGLREWAEVGTEDE